MTEAIANRHISGDGPFTKAAQDLLQRSLGAQRALLTTNCTHALEMSALLLHIQPGDEVLLPAFTFVSTVNAFALRGAVPVFVDIRPDTLNIDESLLEQAVTNRTKAIVVVHYAGVACEMDAIASIAQRHGLAIVEDNAHGLFSRYKGRYLGTYGSLATQSFHETKNFTCGEGGALIVNDSSLIERAEILREKGTNRARFFRGQVDKYTWVDVGSSYVPSDLLAAFLLAQLERRDFVQDTRKSIWHRYAEALAGWAERNAVSLPYIPPHCEQSYHMFYLIMPSSEDRDRFLIAMRDLGVNAVFHYLPLDLAPAAASAGARGVCPVTRDISARLVRLPFYNTLDEADQTHVISAVTSYSCTANA